MIAPCSKCYYVDESEGKKKEVQHERGVEETKRDHVAAFQESFGRQQGHSN